MTAHDPQALFRRLETVLATKLSLEVAAQGARLLGRLKGPVQIAVIGRAGSGKSELVRFLERQNEFPVFEVSQTTLVPDLAPLRAAVYPADIVLWCCQTFNAAELLLWSQMPDVIKDHSFLVLTKADILAGRDLLNAALQALSQIAAEEFHSLFAISTLQAIEASRPDQTAAFRASGAAALRLTLLKQLELDREATCDSASLFLDRHQSSCAILEIPSVAIKPAATFIWQEPLMYFRSRADGLRDALLLPSSQKIKAVLDHCCDTAEGLADLMGRTGEVAAEDSARIQEILAVADTMVLLRLEGTASAATDALALLFQVRRDLSQISND